MGLYDYAIRYDILVQALNSIVKKSLPVLPFPSQWKHDEVLAFFQDLGKLKIICLEEVNSEVLPLKIGFFLATVERDKVSSSVPG